ncbi:helix-turn-helix transcriptional regulator [Croceicoccus gelatinilyticus]|uniref:helix-turn-helix transcriptional regulator n=1 Tax=Croceicoccus gelatinilyticus TaxID=2835536 RepID=UPI001BD17C8C|nr:LuxR C-terminal-related transcriptional regulator [Croceicoccus gelatinilyticus]MBS7668706.1 response regulator transcription factor [Croceicoccus gelatinilyticus]
MSRKIVQMDHCALHAPTADLLGDVLLGLHDAARTPDLVAFQTSALDQIRRLVSFDASIWGIGTVSKGRTLVSAAHVTNMSDEAVAILNREDARNLVGKVMREQPGRAHVFSSSETFKDAPTRALWSQLGGVRQVLCHGTLNSQAGLLGFFALSRYGEEPFSANDARWIEVIAPHLEATLQICRVSELQQVSDDSANEGERGPRFRAAVCDARGVLHVAEPGFAEALQQEWPQWRGPELPVEIAQQVLEAGRRDFRKGRLEIEVTGSAQQRIVRVAAFSVINILTRQERCVAKAYAKGMSHKDVAKMMQRSPATVRHHLRNIYAKLEIHDKAQLAGAIFGE